MANKTNPLDTLAQDFVDSIKAGSNSLINKAQYDKSYPTQIVGVNRRFTKDVPVDKQTELISTYNIPETVTGDNYYTFVINGVYYCTQSNINFILYEKVVVRVPNGNWNRIFIEARKAKDGTNGVGQFTNAENDSERFNDYVNNLVYGRYQHAEGANNATASNAIASGENAVHSGTTTTINFNASLLSQLVVGNKYFALLFIPSSEFDEDALNTNKALNYYTEFTYETGMTSVSITATNAMATAWKIFGTDSTGYNHTEGQNNVNASEWSNVSGSNNLSVGGIMCHTSGYGNRNDGYESMVTGGNNYCSGTYSFLSGQNNIVKDYNCLVGGEYNYVSANGRGSIVGGNSQKVNGHNNVVCGDYNNVSTYASMICGYNNIVEAGNGIVCGRENKITNVSSGIACGAGNEGYLDGSLGVGYNGDFKQNNAITVGGGNSSTLSNILEFSDDGNMSISGNYNTMGADYAEYYEWEDKNVNNEDRKCLFVTLDGDKIRVANDSDDYILGIVSACPSIIGNSAEMEWSNKFLRNIYGEYERDEKGDRIVNPNYNPDNEYIPRSQRPEWVTIGTHGQLVVCDDGSCLVNSFCRVSKDGKATYSKTKTDYRVIKRIDDTHVKVVLK